MFTFLAHSVLFVVIVALVILAAVLYFNAAARAKAKAIADADLAAAKAEFNEFKVAAAADVAKVVAKL